MYRGLILAVGIIAVLFAGCGGDEDEAPPPTATRPAAATPSGSLSGTLVWRQAPYLHTGDLAGDVAPSDLERLDDAEVGPERIPLEVFGGPPGSEWQLLSQGEMGWLIWEPLALVEARRQLAESLGLAPEAVEVRDVERVDWSDSCLGAGGPAEICAQVITPGFRLDLRAGGDDYEYRSDLGGRVRPGP